MSRKEVVYRGNRRIVEDDRGFLKTACEVFKYEPAAGGAPNVLSFPAKLDSQLKLRNHSPTGFEWGFEGSGPAQLALAILCDYLGDSAKALFHYQEFKSAVIAQLDYQEWEITAAAIEEFFRTESYHAQVAASASSPRV